MSKITFNDEQIKILKSNPNVKKVTSKAITYTTDFKITFINEYNSGKLPRDIFEENGFDINIIGIKRIGCARERWMRQYEENGLVGLVDARKKSSGRPSSRELTLEEKLAKAEAKIKLIEAENDFLKKLDWQEGRQEKKLRPSEIYEIIYKLVNDYNLEGLTSYLCKVSGVSRSGYYNYFSVKSIKSRDFKQESDNQKFKLVNEAFKHGKAKFGAKQIKMYLERVKNIIINLKCIRRIMKKYGLVCKIRKQKPYSRMIKATKEHRVHENLLDRNFKQGVPYKVLLTDITYIRYSKKFAYLSAVLDASTDEILAYKLSDNLKLDFVLDTVKNLSNIPLSNDAMIHSDQGGHYTSPCFSKAVKQLGLKQSMSRRGNCWDNAPMESFFGHLKDIIDIEDCKAFQEVEHEVIRSIKFYNNERYKWDLKKMTPVEYRNHLLTCII